MATSRTAAVSVAGLLLSVSLPAQATVSEVDESHFDKLDALTFDALPYGPLKTEHAAFLQFGLVSLDAVAGYETGDEAEALGKYSQVLWPAYPTGIQTVNGTELSGRPLPTLDHYDLLFVGDITLFGVFLNDVAHDVTIQFYDDGVLVGEVTGVSGWSNYHYYQSDVPFDQVILSNNIADGFGIGELRVDAVEIEEAKEPDDTGTPADTGTPDTDPEDTGEPDTDPGDADSGTPNTDDDGDGDGETDSEGCGCSARPAPASAIWMVVLGGLAFLRRQRG